MDILTQREERILIKRINGQTFVKIGKFYNISATRARQIYLKANRKAQVIADRSVEEALGIE